MRVAVRCLDGEQVAAHLRVTCHRLPIDMVTQRLNLVLGRQPTPEQELVSRGFTGYKRCIEFNPLEGGYRNGGWV